MVRFGAEGTWTFKQMQGLNKVECDKDLFGDPLKGTKKSCAYSAAPSPLPIDGWTSCANERHTCELPAGADYWVRFGKGNTWFFRRAEGSIKCNDDVFGDPLQGTNKGCEYHPGTLSRAQWNSCASEGNSCELPGDSKYPVLVKYGANGSFVLRHVMGSSIKCANSLFGDVSFGATKNCYITNTGVW
eukprot:TRINITY_DN1315_c0_g1_i2.p2 TRINITY_DN1315_c0_g1~~TRINITY_DN1315_c0_g1_i2.p2  ORF type:complete len:187 (+),score=1.06 TRINITY_DN1315_c0_g1_i2:903-1463(+)